MRHWSLLGVTVFAIGMGMFFAVTGSASVESGRAAIPASLAFTAVGMLGGMTFAALQSQEGRLRRVEAGLKELQRTFPESTPTTNSTDG